MFAPLINKLIGIVCAILSVVIVFVSVYQTGVSHGKAEKQKLIDDMNARAEIVDKLATKETVKVKKEYVYRDRVIVQKGEDLEKKVEDGVLKEESKDCRIGPNFIRLHNAATQD